jgi:hypothetical protein
MNPWYPGMKPEACVDPAMKSFVILEVIPKKSEFVVPFNGNEWSLIIGESRFPPDTDLIRTSWTLTG